MGWWAQIDGNKTHGGFRQGQDAKKVVDSFLETHWIIEPFRIMLRLDTRKAATSSHFFESCLFGRRWPCPFAFRGRADNPDSLEWTIDIYVQRGTDRGSGRITGLAYC